MNATDNPAPGVAVARSIRKGAGFEGRLVGLGYDALDPGFYAQGLLDAGGILPFPSLGREALLGRLVQLRESFGIDALLPTLDSEMRAVAALGADLRAKGIHTFVPTLESLDAASKAQLHKLASHPGVQVPASEPVVSADGLMRALKRFGFPTVVKGVYYGGTIVHGEAEALAAFHRYVATWGVPVIVQEFIAGEEYDIAAIGDGKGGLVGAVPMRKMSITDKGKGWSGVTVSNPGLLEMTEAVVSALTWRGPLEVEVLRRNDDGELFVVEINPRFPAWIYLSTGAGLNLPYLCTLLALEQPLPNPIPPYRPGTMFVRIALDEITDMSVYEQLSATGTMHSRKVPS